MINNTSISEAFDASERWVRIQLYVNGELFPGSIQSVSVNEIFGDSENIALGSTASHSLTIRANSFGSVNYTNAEIVLKIGAGDDLENINYEDYGKFYVTSVNSTDDYKSGTITAMDGFSKLTTAYVPAIELGSVTYESLVEDVLSNTGVSVNWSGCADFVRSKRSVNVWTFIPEWFQEYVTAMQSGAYTRTQIIGFVAARLGCNAVFDRTGYLVFRRFTEAGYEIDRAHIYQEGFNRTTQDLVTIYALDFQIPAVLSTQGSVITEEDGAATATPTLPTGWTASESGGDLVIGLGRKLTLSTPFFFSEAEAQEIYSSVLPNGSMSYQPCTLKHRGNPCIEPGDVVTVLDAEGNSVPVYITQLTMEYDGGLYSVASAAGKSDAEDAYVLGAGTSGGLTSPSEIAGAAKLSLIELSSVKATIQKLVVEDLTAIKATINNLDTNFLRADSAIIKDLQTNSLKVDFANIDYENVDVSNIAQLFANVGLIDRATIVDGHITGFLDAVEINANNITAGTLIAERIALVQTDEDGNQTGLIYALNNLGELRSNSVNTIDGAVITKRTITADHIVAKSLTANEIDVEDLFAQTVTATNLTISGNSTLNGVTATDLAVTGNSTFSGELKGATGVFSGSIEAENIRISSWKSSTDNVLFYTSDSIPNNEYAGQALSIWATYGSQSCGLLLDPDTIHAGHYDDSFATAYINLSSSQVYIQAYDTGDHSKHTRIIAEVNESNNGEYFSHIDLYADSVTVSGKASIGGNLSISGTLNGYKVEGTSGAWFSAIPVIRNDGVIELGKYIDFHASNTGTTDYDVRLTAESGKLTCSGALYASNFNGYTLAAACARGVKTLTAVGTLGWGTNNNYLADLGMLAYWNGAYTGTSSNLRYCANGTIIGTSNISSYANLYTLPTAAIGTKGGVQLAHGTKSDVSVAANSYTDVTITFSTAFPGTPGVVVSRHAASSASTNVASSANRTIVTHSVTATGFKVRCYNNTSASWASTFRWLAIYRG
ncbi:MAG: hypothetical protein Q4F79_12615 [Eubacteriales bacterium]|nr:hypothetical protein [Eubacteriales bacterium]